jgi:hypothetical protein
MRIRTGLVLAALLAAPLLAARSGRGAAIWRPLASST